MLKVGDRFSSYADVKKAIEELGENTHTVFWKRDARTIESSKVVRPIENCLIYYQLVYACNHGGKTFKSKGKKIRQSWSFKEDCPVHVRFKASSDGKALEVTSIQSMHNHDTLKTWEYVQNTIKSKRKRSICRSPNTIEPPIVDFIKTESLYTEDDSADVLNLHNGSEDDATNPPKKERLMETINELENSIAVSETTISLMKKKVSIKEDYYRRKLELLETELQRKQEYREKKLKNQENTLAVLEGIYLHFVMPNE